MSLNLINITPVLPSDDLDRDNDWYVRLGFSLISKDDLYAVLKRDQSNIHLQWHANTMEDPLNGGSVIKLFVQNILVIFKS